MEKIKTYDELKVAIVELELQQEEQVQQLRYQADIALESLKPANLIKSVFNRSAEPSHTSGNLLSNSVGLSAGYIAKLVVQSAIRRPFGRLVGTAIMFGVQTMVAKHPNTIRTIGTGLFSLLRRNKKEEQTEIDLDNYSENEATR